MPEEVAEAARCDAQRVEGTRATQDIPPATRRMVLARHHRRCGVPGCRHSVFLDVHHVVPREEGGAHDPENLLAACSAHHHAVHHGALRVEGTWSTGFRFTHADGSAYGSPAKAANAALFIDLYQALRSLDFPDRQTRALVDQVRPQVGADATLDHVLRMALAASRGAGVARPSAPH